MANKYPCEIANSCKQLHDSPDIYITGCMSHRLDHGNAYVKLLDLLRDRDALKKVMNLCAEKSDCGGCKVTWDAISRLLSHLGIAW